MIRIPVAELYSHILNRTGCSLKEAETFITAESIYWGLPGSIYYDMDGNATYDDDEMYTWLCQHTVLDDDLINEMIDAQEEAANGELSSEEKYAAAHNMITRMKENHEESDALYHDVLVYGASVYREILRENHTDLDDESCLMKFMYCKGFTVNASNYWSKGDC